MAYFYDFCANDVFVSLLLCSKWDVNGATPEQSVKNSVGVAVFREFVCPNETVFVPLQPKPLVIFLR